MTAFAGSDGFINPGVGNDGSELISIIGEHRIDNAAPAAPIIVE